MRVCFYVYRNLVLLFVLEWLAWSNVPQSDAIWSSKLLVGYSWRQCLRCVPGLSLINSKDLSGGTSVCH